MNANKLLFSCFLLIGLTACGRSYHIEGVTTMSRLDGKLMYLKSLNEGVWTNLDSAEVVHGQFSMKGKADSAQMVSLYMDDQNLMPVILENGTIRITISDTLLAAAGTKLNESLYGFIRQRNHLEQKLAELSDKETRMVIEGGNIMDIQRRLAAEGDSLVKALHAHAKQFIASNYENVLGPGVFIMLCNSLPYPVITPQIDDILRDAPYSFKDHKMVKEFLSVARENMQLIEERRRMEHLPPPPPKP